MAVKVVISKRKLTRAEKKNLALARLTKRAVRNKAREIRCPFRRRLL